MEFVTLQKKSRIPKYKQIVISIEQAILGGILKKGDLLPSLNAIRDNHKVSRDTVLSAFNELKNRGIVHSVVGKGYYVSRENIEVKQRIFLLFDELNSFKEDLYSSFLKKLESNIQVDIFFHHFNIDVFNKLIEDNIGNYNYYVIMPANLNNTENVIVNLPKDKVYILDQIHENLKEYAGIYQNFEKDIFKGLNAILANIIKYQKFILLFSDNKQPKGILNGFLKFCNQYNIKHEVIDSLENRTLVKGEIYMVLEDKNLIRVIKKLKEKKLILAKEIGVISFNDTLLKEIVEGGITAISTNFKYMGERLAQMILNNEQVKIENPSSLILRKSI